MGIRAAIEETRAKKCNQIQFWFIFYSSAFECPFCSPLPTRAEGQKSSFRRHQLAASSPLLLSPDGALTLDELHAAALGRSEPRQLRKRLSVASRT